MIRTEEGQLRKENPEVTDALEESLARLKIAMNRAELMSSLKSHPGWEAIQEILDEKLKQSERKLDGFDKNDHRVNDLLMQERKNFRFFKSIVDDFLDSIPKFEAKINEIQKQLDERRKSATV